MAAAAAVRGRGAGFTIMNWPGRVMRAISGAAKAMTL